MWSLQKPADQGPDAQTVSQEVCRIFDQPNCSYLSSYLILVLYRPGRKASSKPCPLDGDALWDQSLGMTALLGYNGIYHLI